MGKGFDGVGIREVRALGLTGVQREALEWLKAKRDAWPLSRKPYGFNPPKHRSALSASMRRSLAARGFVQVERVSESHLRYDITDAGRAALARTLADANSNNEETP
jgi:hypothetical protein